MTRYIDAILQALAYLGLALIGLAAIVTVADVLLRNFGGRPIFGVVDLTQLMMMYAVFFSIAYGFSVRSHVAVTILTDLLGGSVNRALAIFWWLVSAAVLGFLCYATLQRGLMAYQYGDVSQNLRLPMSLYWAPVVVGFFLSMLGALRATLLERGDSEAESAERALGGHL